MSLRAIVGYNGSLSSTRALKYTLRQFQDECAPEVIVCHVDQSAFGVAEAPVTWDYVPMIEASAARILKEAGVRWEFVVRVGDPVRALERLADERAASVVVVGDGHGWMHQIGIYSISRRLSRRLRQPVWVVT
jgi:nucleotide-binding universal stress UspA family protein